MKKDFRIKELQYENEKLIEKQQKEIEELKKYIEKYKIRIPMPEEYYNRENWGEEITIAQKEYIAVDKIKAKIEECEKDIEIYNNYEENWYKIEVLQSLLEKE